MEWSGQQQIQRLLQSIALGALQGLLLDVITGCVRISKHKRWLWTDVLFGPLAAIITFFGALVIMDGQLHPILLVGVLSGMLFEHFTIGAQVCRLVRYVRCWMNRIVGNGCRAIRYIFNNIGRYVGSLLHFRVKLLKSDEKQRKLFRFFQKKT